MDYQNEDSFNLYYIVDYIKQNFIGLIIFVIVFLIIYIVDYINNYNLMLFQVPNLINAHSSSTKKKKN